MDYFHLGFFETQIGELVIGSWFIGNLSIGKQLPKIYIGIYLIPLQIIENRLSVIDLRYRFGLRQSTMAA